MLLECIVIMMLFQHLKFYSHILWNHYMHGEIAQFQMGMIIFLHAREVESQNLPAVETGGVFLNEKDPDAIVGLAGVGMHAIYGLVA